VGEYDRTLTVVREGEKKKRDATTYTKRILSKVMAKDV
tara:strand:+ start:279 stop:392 length:114 start_codon:yes stop_codon:yes gene_type:complete